MKHRADTLATLAGLVGADAAAAIGRAFAGRRLYIPQTPGANHPITAVAGQIAADALAKAYGGTHIDLPIAQAKHAEVADLAAANLTRREIVERTRYSERHVYRLLAKADRPAGPDLFTRKN